MYPKIQSKFILSKIKGISYNYQRYRRYIDELVLIEQILTGQKKGLVAEFKKPRLKENYPLEWDMIQQELNPQEYSKSKKQELEDEMNHQKHLASHNFSIKKERDQWIKLGGLP